MFKKRNIIGSMLVFVLVLLMTACSPAECTPSAAQETENAANIIAARTEAAITVIAEITEDARLNPSATPTETPLPSPTATSLPSLTPLPASTVTSTKPPAAVAKTPTLSPTPSEFACQIVEKSPPDGTTYPPGGDFDGVWVLKNTGTEEWDAENVDYGYVSGENFSQSDERYDLGETVKPGDEIKIIVDMNAPDAKDEYQTTWGILSGSKTYCTFSLSIEVVD